MIAAGRAERERWQIWLRVLDLGLVPPVAELERLVRERTATGERLWQRALEPRLRAEFPALFDPADPRLAGEVRRVASAAYGVGQALYRLHGADGTADDADEAARLNVWFTLAAAGMDHLVDDGIVDGDELRRHLAPGRVLDALAGGPPVEVPGHPWVNRLLGLGLDGLAARMARGDGEFHREVCGEARACIRAMLTAQLTSDRLRLSPWSNLVAVRRDLRAINALTVWMGCYVGLLGRRRPSDENLRAVRNAATLVGDIGWALDALSDLHADLEHGVWSLVWLELAEVTGTDAPWLRAPDIDPAQALDALAAARVVDRILTRLGLQLDELERDPVLGRPGAELAALCRFMVWAFLAVAEPPS